MKKNRRITAPGHAGKELARLLNSLGHRYPIDRVFRDWLEMSAIAVANSVDRLRFAAREERYLSIVKQYERHEVNQLCEMFGCLVLELDMSRKCVFGPLIADLELGRNARMGQFFTPWPVCQAMARMNFTPISDVKSKIAEQSFITMMEPACGAGAMTLAAAEVLYDEGINYQKCLHVTAIDIDPMCVHMAFLQTSLLGIPACIVQGDVLRNTETDHWFTPLHVLGGWSRRLDRGKVEGQQQGDAPSLPTDGPIAQTMAHVMALLSDTPPPQDVEEVLTPQLIASRMGQWRMEHAAGSTPPFPVSTAT